MTRVRTAIAVWVLLLLAALPVQAEEVIRSFISDVTVDADGRLEVLETIVVRSEAREIRRGILRDFPITYIDRCNTAESEREVLGTDRFAIQVKNDLTLVTFGKLGPMVQRRTG